ncbi:hypothetical protein PQX77_001461 [Marasmius sp. AFHP31]|nr:hypothetical protein PQX77_001461 [Marasmius sp. AFHP31]
MSNFPSQFCSNFTDNCTCSSTAYPYNNTCNEHSYSNSALGYPQPSPYNAQVPSSDVIPIPHPPRSFSATTTTYLMSQQLQSATHSLLLAPDGSQAPSPPMRLSPDHHGHGQYPGAGAELVAQRPRRQGSSSSRATAPVHPYPYTVVQRRLRPNPQVSDEDEETLGELPANASDQQRIEYQRQRNTLAARRSRKRKELYRQELEQMVDELTHETEKWKARAEMLRRVIQNQGLPLNCPDWSD